MKKRTDLELIIAAALEADGGFPPWLWDYQFNTPRTEHDIDFAWVRFSPKGTRIVRGVHVHGGQYTPCRPGDKYPRAEHSNPKGLFRDAEVHNFETLHPTDDIRTLVLYTDHVEVHTLQSVERIRTMLLMAGFAVEDPDQEIRALLAGDLDLALDE